MAGNLSGPSELHLKKELSVIRKTRGFRDPETCSSWRSPSSRSFAATCDLNSEEGTKEGTSYFNRSSEVLSRRKKVYLYNWKNRSSKFDDCGDKMGDTSWKGSLQGSPRMRSISPLNIDFKTDTSLDYFPTNSRGIRCRNTKTSRRRTSRESKRSVISRKRTIHNRLSSSLKQLNSVEQSDETVYSNSDDLSEKTLEPKGKKNIADHCASPFFSGSGCENLSHSKTSINSRSDWSPNSCSPASNSFCDVCGRRKPSNIESWDETSSFDEDQLDAQGDGTPYCGSKRSKDRGTGFCFSPLLSDVFLCGSRTLCNKISSDSDNQKCLPKSSQVSPLLPSSSDEGRSSVRTSGDDLSAKFAELDLEAASRLDGTSWLSFRSQEQELFRSGVAEPKKAAHRSLIHKYKPRSFNEIVGQNIVIESLNNAILKGRVAPAYIFQGPRGTGKTSTARIFAAALNCMSTEENKPCESCRECSDFSYGNVPCMREVDATNENGLARVGFLLKTLPTFSPFNVFVIDECHLLSSKSWLRFLKFLEEPHPRVVFIFTTNNLDRLPHSILSRCQKFIFHKIKEADIVFHLSNISAQENLEVEQDALGLIALNSDGSLRDAETLLDQLSLLGKRITSSLVNDIIGAVSDEKLLDLLEGALSSNTAETVTRSREMMETGVDPAVLISQLAGLIMDIIAGNDHLCSSRGSRRFLSRQSLAEAELERLQHALMILSEAEKQLRVSNERSTWFTAALLQIGSVLYEEPTLPRCSSRSSRCSNKQNNVITYAGDATSNGAFRCMSSNKLNGIWRQCIDNSPATLRQLMSSQGKLVSITENEGVLIAHILFDDDNVTYKAEGLLNNITNAIEAVLTRKVVVRIGLASGIKTKAVPDSSPGSNTDPIECDSVNGSARDQQVGTIQLSEKTVDSSEDTVEITVNTCDNSPIVNEGFEVANSPTCSFNESDVACGTKERKQETLENMASSKSIHEQVTEKTVSLSTLHSKTETCKPPHRSGSGISPILHNKQFIDEIEDTKSFSSQVLHKEQVGPRDAKYQCAISPSMLHSHSHRTSSGKQKLDNESTTGCCRPCWSNRYAADREKVKPSSGRRSTKGVDLLCFRYHGSPLHDDSRMQK